MAEPMSYEAARAHVRELLATGRAGRAVLCKALEDELDVVLIHRGPVRLVCENTLVAVEEPEGVAVDEDWGAPNQCPEGWAYVD